ncbi:helix-turn-helix domain-containing protein [Nonomuraea sp. NPDC050556]|uniref:helix-turn-helix domain-containing protein n=1 Tax=Nonomuraea sp. NPDC050556 TaxID=3364369 RepID=UPI00379E02FE
MEEARSRHLGPKDTGALKAISHPLRMRLLLAIDEIGPVTVGMLATHLSQPVGVISYHLRQLAAHGLVAEVPELARDRRERWWRFVPTESLSITPSEFVDDPVGRVASRELMLQWIDVTAEQMRRWVEGMHAWPPDWQDAATLGRKGPMRMTPEDMRQFDAELEALIERWRSRGEEADDSPERRQVVFFCHAEPLGPPPAY